MSLNYYLVGLPGLLFLILLLWRGPRVSWMRHYPFFYTYIGYLFVLAIIQIALAESQISYYPMVYWICASVVVLLRFFVIWEIFRNSFSTVLAIRGVAAQIIGIVAAFLALTFVLWGTGTVWFFQDLERKGNFAQAVLLLAVVIMARHYAIPLGRNIRGMALGLGIYISLSIVNYAALDVFQGFVRWWGYIHSANFALTTGIWLWALWDYAPNPKLSAESPDILAEAVEKWNKQWDALWTALRKGMGL